MTQIKLRRDTAANFTSKNPVLGIGEPAYETDTKKLKIGDGTTAYTQLEYFSAGGGSTNITATLPLKIVDGVISLEVDGQTIQIVDGKLHANLDDKQDKFTPIAPLGINQITISNVTNGTFLTDTSVTLNSAFGIYCTTNSDARALIYVSGASSVGVTPTSFIQIPFTLGDLISFPFEKDNDDDIGLVFGYWKDGLFYPTMLYKTNITRGSDSNSYAPFSFVSEAGKSSLEKIATYYGQSSTVNKSALVYHESMSLNATNYIQVTKNAGVPTVNMWFTTAGRSWPNSGFTQRMYTSDTTVLENFNKTNVCLLLSNDTSKVINLTKVTRRELGNTVLDPTVDALTTALNTYSDSFDATAKVTTNDLSLAIGSGLSVVDGKLTSTGGITTLSTGYQDLPLPTREVWYKSVGNGYIAARFASTAANQFCQLGINSDGTGIPDSNSDYDGTQFSQGPNNKSTIILPISKDHYYSCNWNYGGGIIQLRFIQSINK